MPKYTVKVAGSEKLERKLKQLPEHMQEGLRTAVRDSAKAIRADARTRVPVDSGDLRKSIKFRTAKGGLSATIRVDEFYGRFVEFGTTSQAAQPFLGPAAQAERTRFPGRISDDVRKALGLR